MSILSSFKSPAFILSLVCLLLLGAEYKSTRDKLDIIGDNQRFTDAQMYGMASTVGMYLSDLYNRIDNIERELTPQEKVDRFLKPVVLVSYQPLTAIEKDSLQDCIGSGTIIKSIKDDMQYVNYVLTAHHVISDHGRYKVVRFDYNGSVVMYDATIVGSSYTFDLSLITFKTDAPMPTAKLATNKPVMLEKVALSGLRVGSEIPVVTFGNMAKNFTNTTLPSRWDNHWLVQAPAIFGVSGGPTFNMSGEIVGVNVMGLGDGRYGMLEQMCIIVPLPIVKLFIDVWMD